MRASRQPSGTKIEMPSDPQGCTPVRITTADGKVSGGIICFDRQPRKRCEVCGQLADRYALCDYPVGGSCKKCKGTGLTKDGYNCEKCAGTKRQMCNKRLCSKCGVHTGEDEDYCPSHREAAGLSPLILREPCAWHRFADLSRNDKCLRAGCATRIPGDGTVKFLYFTMRGRAMCEPCGIEYLKISTR